jgi:DNA-binding response OmpR family regulator
MPYHSCVAVLDDDIRFIRMVERVLAEEHIAVCPVTTIDLDEAVNVIRESGCRMALVDIFMYGHAAGFELIERLRSDATMAQLPVIVTSGARKEVGERGAFLRRHNCDVLLKPFSCDQLLAHMASLDHAPAAIPDELIVAPATAVNATVANATAGANVTTGANVPA